MKRYVSIILGIFLILVCIYGLLRYRVLSWLLFLAIGVYFLYPKSNTVTSDKTKETNTENDTNQPKESINFSIVTKEEKIEQFEKTLSSLPIVEFNLSENKKSKKRSVSDLEYDTFKKPNITKSTKYDSICDFIVIDIETTGIAVSNSIVEVSAIKFINFKPTELFTSLIKPPKPITEETISIHGITNEMTENAPTFSQIAPAFSEFISGYNIIGHNLSFDMKFLFVNGIDFSPKCRYYDTLDIARKTIKKYSDRMSDYETIRDSISDYKLETLLDYYGIERKVAHRSSSDCLATGYLFYELINDKTGYAFS